jgi:hypothetical protein
MPPPSSHCAPSFEVSGSETGPKVIKSTNKKVTKEKEVKQSGIDIKIGTRLTIHYPTLTQEE